MASELADEPELGLSQATTIPGSPRTLGIDVGVEAISSDTDVEMTKPNVEQIISETLTPEQELAKMKDHERFGFYWRVVEKQQEVERRVRAVSDAVAQESPVDRKCRRKTFQTVVLNHED